jgi:hypothetical protein
LERPVLEGVDDQGGELRNRLRQTVQRAPGQAQEPDDSSERRGLLPQVLGALRGDDQAPPGRVVGQGREHMTALQVLHEAAETAVRLETQVSSAPIELRPQIAPVRIDNQMAGEPEHDGEHRDGDEEFLEREAPLCRAAHGGAPRSKAVNRARPCPGPPQVISSTVR